MYISQNDLEKRSQQVSVMSEICSKVWHVIIWLAEGNNLSIDFISRINELQAILCSRSAISNCESSQSRLNNLFWDSCMNTSIFDPSRQSLKRKFDWEPFMKLFSSHMASTQVDHSRVSHGIVCKGVLQRVLNGLVQHY